MCQRWLRHARRVCARIAERRSSETRAIVYLAPSPPTPPRSPRRHAMDGSPHRVARPKPAGLRHNADMLPLFGLGDRLNNQLGSMKKPTPGRFSLASPELRSRPYHQPSASRNLTPQISAPGGAGPIHGIGQPLRGWLACHRRCEAKLRANLRSLLVVYEGETLPVSG